MNNCRFRRLAETSSEAQGKSREEDCFEDSQAGDYNDDEIWDARSDDNTRMAHY